MNFIGHYINVPFADFFMTTRQETEVWRIDGLFPQAIEKSGNYECAFNCYLVVVVVSFISNRTQQ